MIGWGACRNRLLASDPRAAGGSVLTNGGRQPRRHGLRRWLAVWVATALALVGSIVAPVQFARAEISGQPSFALPYAKDWAAG